ncbi:MAG: ABC transporter substrate-binding protein [Acidimicrobiia bacterium]|nr:ABC transporter substrate-binding protein [Acidimicrobiia bacterium]
MAATTTTTTSADDDHEGHNHDDEGHDHDDEGHDHDDETTITVTDHLGREVVIPTNVERVASVGAYLLYGLPVAIGAKDKIVATSNVLVGMYQTIMPEIADLPAICETCFGSDVDYEQIIELGIDLLILDPVTYGDGTIAATLEPEIPVYVTDLAGPAVFIEELEQLGLILDREAEADSFIQWYQGYEDLITSKTGTLSDADKPSVFSYFGGEWGAGSGPPYGSFGEASANFLSMIEMAGGNLITRDLPGEIITVDPEFVIETDPEFVVREIFSWNSPIMGFDKEDNSEASDYRDEVMDHDAFKNSTAVRNEDVQLLFSDVGSGIWFVGIASYAKILHPDLFADLDPLVILQEYLTDHLGSSYDVSTNGVFTFPGL